MTSDAAPGAPQIESLADEFERLRGARAPHGEFMRFVALRVGAMSEAEKAAHEARWNALRALDASDGHAAYKGSEMGADEPRALARGPRVVCSCTSEMLADQFAKHVDLVKEAAGRLSAWTLHGAKLAEAGLPAGTPPAIVAHLPSIEATVSLELQAPAPEAHPLGRPVEIPSAGACEDAPVSPAIHTAPAHDSAELPLFARARVA